MAVLGIPGARGEATSARTSRTGRPENRPLLKSFRQPLVRASPKATVMTRMPRSLACWATRSKFWQPRGSLLRFPAATSPATSRLVEPRLVFRSYLGTAMVSSGVPSVSKMIALVIFVPSGSCGFRLASRAARLLRSKPSSIRDADFIGAARCVPQFGRRPRFVCPMPVRLCPIWSAELRARCSSPSFPVRYASEKPSGIQVPSRGLPSTATSVRHGPTPVLL